MKTTADKLTYLSGTKDKLKTAINYTGANITNDTFRSYADKLKLGYIDILNNGTDTLYSNLPKVSGKGSNLSLTPTYEAPMRNIPYGDTLQESSPTPSSPVEIQSVTGLQNVNITGKNLFGLSNTGTNIGVTYTFNGSELTLNGTTTGEGNIYHNTNVITLPAGTYTFSSKKLSGSFTRNSRDTAIYFKNSNNASEVLFTIIAAISYNNTSTITLDVETTLRLQIYTNGTNMVFNNLKIGFQIEKNSTATTYEPYKGNTYEVNLGKNLLDVSQCVNGYINSNGDWSGGNNNLLTPFIPVVPGSDYTISLNTQFSNIGYALYNASKTYISRENNSNKQTLTISIPNDTFYIKVWFNYSGYTPMTPEYILQYEPMIEKGSTASTYSPYFTPIELCKIGDYQDKIYKQNNKWYIHKEVGKIVLNGSENWVKRNNGNGSTTITFQINMSVGSSGVNSEYCNRFVYEQYSSSSGNEGIGIGAEKYSIFFQIKRSRLSSLDVTGFKNWISSNNVEVLYVLETPTYTEITNTDLINQLEALYTAKSKSGITNISSTSENLPMILSASALKVE